MGDKVAYSYDIPISKQFDAGYLNFTFGAISDPHMGTRYGSDTIPQIALGNALGKLGQKNVRLVGISGDVTNISAQTDLEQYKSVVDSFTENYTKIPIYPCTGNHDIWALDKWNTYTGDTEAYNGRYVRKYYGDNTLDYTVDVGNYTFIFYDQQYWNYNTTSSKLVTDEQLTWLSERLSENQNRTVFLFFHTYFASTGNDISNGYYRYTLPYTRDCADEKAFRALIEQYSNVFMFSGHSHWVYYLQDSYNYNTELINRNLNICKLSDTGGILIHIPSVTEPRILYGTATSPKSLTQQQSEGYIIDMYDNCMVLNGYDFINDRYIAYASYILDTKFEVAKPTVYSVSLSSNEYHLQKS